MSYNHFYNNFHGNSTFQNAPQFLPPPPPPPAYFLPPQIPWDLNTRDANFVKQFETYQPRKNTKPKSMSISAVRDVIYGLLLKLKELKSKESLLTEKIHDLSDEEWSTYIQEIEDSKAIVNKILANINNLNLEVLQKLLNKRSAKRARLRRLRSERKKEKEEWINKMQEKSRKIDEKLQKVQDDIQKAKQEEEAKAQADIVLKETLRKKHDAKKFIVKLDALMKLRKARQNTARGRGDTISEVEGDTFNNNIEKLKTLWKQRLAVYETEEAKLRTKLQEDCEEPPSAKQDVADSLQRWKQCLFGGDMPQVDFTGDLAKFVSNRYQWDEFITNSEGSSLPVGWVIPSI